MNKSIQFFKTKNAFDMQEFAQEVIEGPEQINRFYQFKTSCQEQTDSVIADNFAISDSVVKKQSRVFKSVLKLDRKFHIYIHGDTQLIEQGIDADGRKFYKIYFEKKL